MRQWLSKGGWVRGLLLGVGGVWLTGAATAAPAAGSRPLLDQGQALLKSGLYEPAVPLLKEASLKYAASHDDEGETLALLGLAAAYQPLGQYCLTLETLEHAVVLADRIPSAYLRMRARAALGGACLFSRRPKQADTNLREALTLARELKDTDAQISILLNLGNLLVTQRQGLGQAAQGESVRGLQVKEAVPLQPTLSFDEGMQAYGEAIALATEKKNAPWLARGLLNKARGHFLSGDYASAKSAGEEAQKPLLAAGDGRDKTFLLVASGRLYADLAERMSPEGAALTAQAVQIFADADALAGQTGDVGMATYASGYLGRLYARQSRLEEGLALTARALFWAQKAGNSEAQFEWEWQTAQLLRDMGREEPAVAAYRRALQTLQGTRGNLSISAAMRGDGRSFRESAGQAYSELADMLLRKAEQAPSEEEAMKHLIEARNVVETLKSVELEDYFYEDDCASLLSAKVKPLEKAVAAGTAIVYVIPLPDRTELLLTLPGKLTRFKSPARATELMAEANRLRLMLEDPAAKGHLGPAHTLWNWLISPLQGKLRQEKVETLVFVLDGALLTIPMTVLHDGQQYLIEQYAVAVSPGLSLIEPHPMPRTNVRPLLCGVSQAVQGYPALAAVPKELTNINAVFAGKILLDQDFSDENVVRELADRRCSVIHIASHGEFGSDTSRTYILNFTGKMTMDRLEQLILPFQLSARPIELLTLSACQTAAGNDRAALGLAGVAVKAGARSALASLWSVSDTATEGIMTQFYSQLQANPKLNKAQALQKAQRALLVQSEFAHPAYWSPFLLIGNWL